MTANDTTSTALILAGLAAVEITTSAEAIATRDDLLTRARACTKITTADTATQASAMLKELQAFARSIESTRKDVKAPVLDIGKRIDALADELTASITKAIEFYRREIGAYDAEQKRIAEEARRKAWEEEERIRREAEAKERAEAERIAAEQRALAEKARKEQAELEAKANRARSEAGKARALAEAEAARIKAEAEAVEAAKRAEAEALKRQEDEAARVVAAHQLANAALERRVEGVTTRRDVEFEVTDVQALYEACPMLVTLEPKKAMIKSALKDLRDGQSLPGVRHWFVSKAH